MTCPCDIFEKRVLQTALEYQGYHQEMEISGICNPYDYLL